MCYFYVNKFENLKLIDVLTQNHVLTYYTLM